MRSAISYWLQLQTMDKHSVVTGGQQTAVSYHSCRHPSKVQDITAHDKFTTRLSHELILQGTNAGMRRPGYEASQSQHCTALTDGFNILFKTAKAFHQINFLCLVGFVHLGR